jgi:hypothetical protein
MKDIIKQQNNSASVRYLSPNQLRLLVNNNCKVNKKYMKKLQINDNSFDFDDNHDNEESAGNQETEEEEKTDDEDEEKTDDEDEVISDTKVSAIQSNISSTNSTSSKNRSTSTSSSSSSSSSSNSSSNSSIKSQQIIKPVAKIAGKEPRRSIQKLIDEKKKSENITKEQVSKVAPTVIELTPYQTKNKKIKT